MNLCGFFLLFALIVTAQKLIQIQDPSAEDIMQIFIMADSISLSNSKGSNVTCVEYVRQVLNVKVPDSVFSSQFKEFEQLLVKVFNFIIKISDRQILDFRPRRPCEFYLKSTFAKSLACIFDPSFQKEGQKYHSFRSKLKIRDACPSIWNNFIKHTVYFRNVVFAENTTELTTEFLQESNWNVASDRDFLQSYCVSGIFLVQKFELSFSTASEGKPSSSASQIPQTVSIGTKIGAVCLMQIEGVPHVVLVTNRKGSSISPYMYDFPSAAYDGSSNVMRFCVQEAFYRSGIVFDILSSKMLMGPNFEAILLCFGVYVSGSPSGYRHQTEAVHFVPVAMLPNLMVSGLPFEVLKDIVDKISQVTHQKWPSSSFDFSCSKITIIEKPQSSKFASLKSAAQLNPSLLFLKSFQDHFLNLNLNNNFIKLLKFYEKPKIGGLGSVKIIWVLFLLALLLLFLIALILVSFTRIGSKLFKSRYY